MIEAVNSVLQTAPLVKASNEAVSTADSYAANPERVQRSAPQAPYISPYIYLDVNYDKAVIQLRNGETGDVVDQYPSESRLQQQARTAQRQSQAEAATTSPDTQAESAQAQAQQQQQISNSAPTQQQVAAFQAAAQSGNSNAGSFSLFA